MYHDEAGGTRTEGWREEAAESALPLSLSPKCSVVDFSESGYGEVVNDVETNVE